MLSHLDAHLLFAGGMDVYLRQAGGNRTHDEFYTDPTFINAFENYLSQVVPRYVNSPALFGWCVFHMFLYLSLIKLTICE